MEREGEDVGRGREEYVKSAFCWIARLPSFV